MFLDTDVLIWGLKQDSNAVELLDSLNVVRFSAVVYMEILQGACDKRDQQLILKSLEEVEADVVPLNESITEIAIELVKTHSLSSSLYLADTLVAATSLYYKKPLISGNDKHYCNIPDLTLEVFRPVGTGS